MIHQSILTFEIQRDRRMCLGWFVVGLFCVCFALTPWYLLLLQGKASVQFATHWPGLVIVAVWSSLPGYAGVWMLFHALCRIQISVVGGDIMVRRVIGPVQRLKRYASPTGVYLLHRWFHSKNGPAKKRIALVFRLSNNKKKMILDELQARNLIEAFAWLSGYTTIHYRDMRHRKTFG